MWIKLLFRLLTVSIKIVKNLILPSLPSPGSIFSCEQFRLSATRCIKGPNTEAEHQRGWTQVEKHFTVLTDAPYIFSNSWKLRSVGHQTMAHRGHVVIPPYCQPRSLLCSPSHSSPSTESANHAVALWTLAILRCPTLHHAGALAQCPAAPGDFLPLPPMMVRHSHHHLWTLSIPYLPGWVFVLFHSGVFLSWVGEVVLQNSLLFHLRIPRSCLAWGTPGEANSCQADGLCPVGSQPCCTGSWLQPCLIWLISYCRVKKNPPVLVLPWAEVLPGF